MKSIVWKFTERGACIKVLNKDCPEAPATISKGGGLNKKKLVVLGYMGVSKNRGKNPKSSILIGFSIINHPFWGTPIFGNTHIGIIINHYQDPY